METDFQKQIYEDVKRLFPEETVETQVAYAKSSGPVDPSVRLVHIPTGISITCDEYKTQTENYIAAAIRLRVACDKR